MYQSLVTCYLQTKEILAFLAPNCVGSEIIRTHCMCKADFFLTKEELQEAVTAS